MTESVPVIDGLSALAEPYDAFILDLWGVVHDGVRPFPGVNACLAELRARGRTVLLLSNAPRRTGAIAGKLGAMGVDPAGWTWLMSSGEATHEALRDRDAAPFDRLGRRLYHLGPERDVDVYADLPGYTVVHRLAEADFVLNTGPDSYDETVDDHRPVLSEAAERGLPMICANPDLVVMVGEIRAICAGTLALEYEAMGGAVAWIGKPYPAVYRRCLGLMGDPAPDRVLAVGDSLRTDVAGAQAMGFDSLFVAGGIHGEDLAGPGGALDAGRLADLVADRGIAPNAAIAELRW
ncbi:MAG: TIGR01459 family HAD-type hydrolase [Azospirillaceae bacterium]